MKVPGKDLHRLALEAYRYIVERTPGSVTDAWIKEEREMQNKYANIAGMAGET